MYLYIYKNTNLIQSMIILICRFIYSNTGKIQKKKMFQLSFNYFHLLVKIKKKGFI